MISLHGYLRGRNSFQVLEKGAVFGRGRSFGGEVGWDGSNQGFKPLNDPTPKLTGP
jgi:hypothetical protein